MALKGSTTVIPSQARGAARSLADLRMHARAFLPPLLLALLALALTLIYYATAYQTAVYADDRIRGLFVGFQSLEGEREAMPYRWSTGAGQVCLPAIGPSRPPTRLDLQLLGSSVTAGATGRGIDQATLRIGVHALPLTIFPESRTYRMLVPPGPESGPVCLTLESATVDPLGNGRVSGVGLRSVTLSKLVPGGAPPLDQAFVNIWLAVGGYVLLRSLTLPRWFAGGLVAVVTALLGFAMIGGILRVAPDLPFWSSFTAVSLGLMLGSRLLFRQRAPTLSVARRELLGTALVGMLLAFGWVAIANLPGYFWPFPLMARSGSAFGWGVLPALVLGAAYIALTIRWFRAATPPPAPLVIGVGWLAAVTLPATLKVGLRGWDSLFQTFAVQEGSYIRDVYRVGAAPLQFLRDYVALMPDLILHNKTHPPGATLFLWGVERLFGSGPQPATWVVIALAGLIVWPTYRLAATLSGPRAGVLAAAISVLLPAFMIYAATSMDALFAVPMAWAIWCLYAALVLHDAPFGSVEPATLRAQLLAAAATGVWLAIGLLFSFTTLMLAFVVLALVARRIAVGPRRLLDVAHWAAVGGVIAGTVLLILAALWAITGYDSIAAFFSGVANNRVDVGERVSPLGLSSYLFFLAVNFVSFGWYLGPWVLYRLGTASASDIGEVRAGTARPANALGVGAAVLLLGMLLAGLFFREIERIWLFTHILLAAVLAEGMIHVRNQRVWLAAALLITLLLQSVLFRAVLRISW